MKRIILSCLLFLTAFQVQAQRCAVLEFKAGAGISQADVEGISAIFNTYFQPAGYTMVERTQIDKVIDEQGFQRSNITQYQMVRLGVILNVSKVVVGDVTIAMGQYNVDVRVVDVETGTESAKDGATFTPGSSYRSTMQNLAQKLAAQIAIMPAELVYSSQSSTPSQPKKRDTVEVLLGYLKVFPHELGVFQGEPTSVISQINAQAQFGYNSWRIPTSEELSLLRANNYLGSGEYMTKENKSGIVLLVSDGEDYQSQKNKARLESLISQGWVDLGLPSGTLWKKQKEDGGFLTYDEAFNKYGNQLPTREQFQELIDYCKWTWGGTVYFVKGPSGNTIVFSAMGYKNGDISEIASKGYYWSRSLADTEEVWYLKIDSKGTSLNVGYASEGYSVMLAHE